MWQRREALWSESLCWLYPGAVLRVPGHLTLSLAAWPRVSPTFRAAGQQDRLSWQKAPLLSEGGGTECLQAPSAASWKKYRKLGTKTNRLLASSSPTHCNCLCGFLAICILTSDMENQKLIFHFHFQVCEQKAREPSKPLVPGVPRAAELSLGSAKHSHTHFWITKCTAQVQNALKCIALISAESFP